MTREECEQEIIAKCHEIQKIYEQYGNPNDYHLSITVWDHSIFVNNRYWETNDEFPVTDAETPIDTYWRADSEEEEE